MKREQVPNPFLFKYYSTDGEQGAAAGPQTVASAPLVAGEPRTLSATTDTRPNAAALPPLGGPISPPAAPTMRNASLRRGAPAASAPPNHFTLPASSPLQGAAGDVTSVLPPGPGFDEPPPPNFDPDSDLEHRDSGATDHMPHLPPILTRHNSAGAAPPAPAPHHHAVHPASGKENAFASAQGAAAAGPGSNGSTASLTPRSSRVIEVMSSHLSCPVCCDWLVASHTLSCGHMFCGLCLATWLSQNHSCPSCRKTTTSECSGVTRTHARTHTMCVHMHHTREHVTTVGG